ncbi:hypothetical protein [Vibrio spartinae]|uniref:Uncharacterized protein n=1 Tax=Vibrio spartinae TaxID=1918945 RepID=A0A1N6MA81_9VIBR|nr:hypothetical protein [Vibrio spartinae]SIO96321.1 hypothetical protein VSP9026_04105 [Vibrio spartinae]
MSLHPLNELLIKQESDYYNPQYHGDGVVVSWNRDAGNVVTKKGLFSSFRSKKSLEYYFVKFHPKPLVVKQLPFEWNEGTSDIELEFDAIFKIRLTSEGDAQKLVEVVAKTGRPEEGLVRLIDKCLDQCMTDLYNQVKSQPGKNLLDEFYQLELQKGESLELNQAVTEMMLRELEGLDFAIGFTLRNAPERIINFNYLSEIEETGLEVTSKCQLRLSNFQSFRKSGLNGVDDVQTFMKSAIDRAVRQHILGKSDMELLSNFNRPSSQDVSISDQVKNSVSQDALSIGYELKSFHTLPDIAPLDLLNGIQVIFDENDGAFRTGQFGGQIRLHMDMDIKSVDGEFKKYCHLFTHSDNDQQVDLLQVTKCQIIERIKVILATICRQAMRLEKQDHFTLISRFETDVKPELEAHIVESMREQHGLDVYVKNIAPVESEDASRQAELCRKKCAFEFDFFNVPSGDNLTLKSVFEVISLSTAMDSAGNQHVSPVAWEAFERHDYGYRADSPQRFEQEITRTDREWKTQAIQAELEDIRKELIHCVSASDILNADIHSWLYDRKHNKMVQQALIDEAKKAIEKSRGLVIDIARFEIKNHLLNSALQEQKERKFENIKTLEEQKAKQQHDQLLHEASQSHKLSSTITDKKIEMIDNDDVPLEEYSNSLVSVSKDESLQDIVSRQLGGGRSGTVKQLEDVLGNVSVIEEDSNDSKE